MQIPLTAILLILFIGAGIVNLFVTWFEIEPVLRRLGYKFEDLWLGKYKGGLLTLWEYKRCMIAEGKSLTAWWLFWATVWTTFALLAVVGVGIVSST